MKKKQLTSFIDKYSLGGHIEKVKLSTKDKTLNVKFVSPTKDLLGDLNLKNSPFPDNKDLCIHNTTQLLRIINVMDNEHDLYIDLENQTRMRIS